MLIAEPAHTASHIQLCSDGKLSGAKESRNNDNRSIKSDIANHHDNYPVIRLRSASRESGAVLSYSRYYYLFLISRDRRVIARNGKPLKKACALVTPHL
jgi:hypothetical protein